MMKHSGPKDWQVVFWAFLAGTEIFADHVWNSASKVATTDKLRDALERVADGGRRQQVHQPTRGYVSDSTVTRSRY